MRVRVLRVAWPWLLVIAVGVAAAWLRYDWIEQSTAAQACLAGARSVPCALRAFAVAHFLDDGFGYAALACAALALLWRHAFSAWLAAAAGILALILYCAIPGALALLVGVLRLARAQARAVRPVTPPQRPRQQQVDYGP